MTTNALEKARAAAETAAQDLAALEAQEAEKAAQKDAQRLEAKKAAAARFLADRPGLEEKVRGEKPTAAEMGKALEAGTLGAMVAEYLARRDALGILRDRASECAQLLGQDAEFVNPRYVDPGEELRRWQEAATDELRRAKAGALAAGILSAYEVA
ncbi:hypothetical protein [Nocardia sp. NPDC058666]|uniref:hypothetical protein n=1 Tax=Actinomycetes TaxID=1760 RepID=UPI0036627C05